MQDIRLVLRQHHAARSLGITLGQIKEILRLRDHGQAPCAYASDVIERRLGEVDHAIDELTQLKAELARFRRRAGRAPARRPSAARYCHILEPA